MYGVIDIGSNTIRLVVYEHKNGHIEQILNKKITAGLAGYINKDHEMRKRGVQVAIDALRELKNVTDRLTLEGIGVFATAPLRNINNTDEVVQQIQEATGFEIKVLSGNEEAEYGFAGMRGESKLDEGLMIDIGGGSTEFVAFHGNKTLYSRSIPWGSLNLYREYVSNITPTEKEVREIYRVMKKHYEKAKLPEGCNTEILCAEGGTARAVGKMIDSIAKEEVDSGRYNRKILKKLLRDYLDNPKKMRERILRVAPERIHTFVPGLVAMNVAADTFDVKEIVTVGFGVREGFLLKECTPVEEPKKAAKKTAKSAAKMKAEATVKTEKTIKSEASTAKTVKDNADKSVKTAKTSAKKEATSKSAKTGGKKSC